MRRAVMDGVVGDHGLRTVEARPRVAVGKQEIFGTGGNGDPQAAALLEAFGEFCGADMDGIYGARLQITGSLKAFPVFGAQHAVRQLDGLSRPAWPR